MHFLCCQLIVAKAKDKNPKTGENGLTPLDYTDECGRQSIIDLLKTYYQNKPSLEINPFKKNHANLVKYVNFVTENNVNLVFFLD